MRATAELGGEKGLRATLEAGVQVQVQEPPLTLEEKDALFAPFVNVNVEVILDVPRADGSTTPSLVIFGGDAASANAGVSIVKPNDQTFPCDQCLSHKKHFNDPAVNKSALRRNYAMGTALSHLHPYCYSRLGKRRRSLLQAHVTCPAPGCGKRIDEASEAAEKAELLGLSSGQLAKRMRAHANTHFGAVLGQEYWITHDNRRNARSALHGRMNAAGNNLAATFCAVPYTNAKECTKRVKGNAVLKRARIKWRFKVSKPKGGKPQRSPQGGCARKLHCDPAVLAKLCKIFYKEELSDALRARLEAATEQAEETVGADVDAEQRARSRAPSRASSSSARRSRLPAATTAGRKRAPGAKAPRAAGATTAATAAAAAAANSAAANPAAAAAEASGDEETTGGESSTGESSAGESSGGEADDEAEDAEVDGRADGIMEQMPMDVEPRVHADGSKTGGLATCVQVWLTSIAFQSHRFEKYDDRDRAAAEQHGETGQRLGAAWADALQRHTGNTANWYYPHWARAHYKENALNGGAAQTDDSILETSNKVDRDPNPNPNPNLHPHPVSRDPNPNPHPNQEKKKLKRHVFNGGSRKKNKKWKVTIQVEDRDGDGKGLGTYHTVSFYRRAMMADFAEVQRKHLIGKRIARKQQLPRVLHPKIDETQKVKSELAQQGVSKTESSLHAVGTRV